MSSSIKPADFSSMMADFREGLHNYLPDSSQRAEVVLASSALVHTAYTILKNLQYSVLTQVGVNTLPQMLSARVSFLEGALISGASTIHNLFFVVIYTALLFATLTLSQNLARDCHKHWISGFYSLYTTGISVVGVITPYVGTGLTYYLFRSIWNSFKRDYGNDLYEFERPLMSHVKWIFNRNHTYIFDTLRGHYGDEKFRNEVQPSLDYIQKQLKAARKVDDLIGLMDDFRRHWPIMDPLKRKRIEEESEN